MTPEEKNELVCAIADAVHVRRTDSALTTDEEAWVRMAVQRQAQSIKLRQAVIEKSITGLVWSAIAGFGYIIIDFFKNHGLK